MSYESHTISLRDDTAARIGERAKNAGVSISALLEVAAREMLVNLDSPLSGPSFVLEMWGEQLSMDRQRPAREMEETG